MKKLNISEKESFYYCFLAIALKTFFQSTSGFSTISSVPASKAQLYRVLFQRAPLHYYI